MPIEASLAITAENVQKAYIAYFGRPADAAGLLYWTNAGGDTTMVNVLNDFAKSAEFTATYPDSANKFALVNGIYQNLFGHAAEAAGATFWVNALNSGAVTVGDVAYNIARGAQGADAAALASKVTYATAFTTALLASPTAAAAYNASTIGQVKTQIGGIDTAAEATAAVANLASLLSGMANPVPAGQNFSLTAGTAAGADVMRITGDMDSRVDFTANDNQVKGLDLNGNGVIQANGVENNNPTTLDDGKDFEIVDAYSRNHLNQLDITTNYLGDVAFDGTGFAGDGVNTNGNIFLGGLGADVAFGGIGNDFLAGGGIAQARAPGADALSGGRNADFFFAEFSGLDATDGSSLKVDGGTTADNVAAGITQSAQDADWLLFEASDDDEPVQIWLNDDNLADQRDGADGLVDGMGRALSRSGESMQLDDVENFDASGNLYGFLNTVNVSIGAAGKTASAEINNNGAKLAGTQNVGIGSSAQLSISGSNAANVLVGGYDNDYIEGRGGNDLLMGGNLNYVFNNVNAAGVVNNGKDEMKGDAGSDGIVFEADGGTIDGGADQDTLWLTRESLGKKDANTFVTADDLTTDKVLRFDLAADALDASSGYFGADAADTRVGGNGSQDQTNYKAAATRVDVTGMESVIATGLGAVDYKAAGANLTSPVAGNTPAFTNQQNHFAYEGNLDLRGTYSESVEQKSTQLLVILGEDDTSGDRPTDDPSDFLLATYSGDLNLQQASIKFITEASAAQVLAFGSLIGSSARVNIVSTPVVISDGVNTLYAAGGDDVLEGRTGGTLLFNGNAVVTGDNRDKLSGGPGNDKFIFALGVNSGDGVDVIHRQTNLDVNADGVLDNLTDGTFGVDFGEKGAVSKANSTFTISLPTGATSNVAGVSFLLNGTVYTVNGLAASTFTAFNTALNAALDADAALAPLNAVLNANNTITITDPAGGTFAKNPAGGWVVTGSLPADGTSSWSQTIGDPTTAQDRDVLIYAAYEDRADGELVDDGSTTGSAISLGEDSYAEDLVVDFAADGTRIAEDQSYVLTFKNLTTEDKVTVTVNSVKYELTVGVDLDGNEIGIEEAVAQGGASTQPQIQAAFLTRLAGFINSFMDDDTAAGRVVAEVNASAGTITLTQFDYNGEETVFMRTPTVALTNGSGGEVATVTVLNNSQHEVQLLDFNGRNAELNSTNVIFIGNTGASRSILETGLNAGTANTLKGSEAVVIDGGVNSLQSTLFGSTTAVADNTATNSFLRTDFTVHGDDLLIGGAASETTTAGTGDDRVLGSLGTDSIDGGKSYYAVKVLGEAQARVYVLNQWEAENPTLVTALTAITSAGGTISSINRIGDAESGNSTPVSAGTAEVFNDTLQFQQADFSANTKFTVVLSGFTGTTAATVAFPNAGSGQVLVDDAGNGTNDATTTFTNFENIRTVSGTGNAVAGSGQGDDTLNVTALSTAVGGVSYDLTNDGAGVSTPGDVRYSKVADTVVDTVGETATFKLPDENDFGTLVIKVDGVESVLAGNGADLLMIDESEAAKNNLFSGGLGLDRIEYLNDFAGVIPEFIAEPTVTIKLDNIAALTTATTGTDTITMTGGRVGATVAVDTLIAVERISLNGFTAEGAAEADLLDVTAMTAGAVVDFTTGQVRDLAGVVHVTIDGMAELENVWADGNDTVIVASTMSASNARSDAATLAVNDDVDLTLATFVDFDTLKTSGTDNTRKSFLTQSTTQIEDVVNQGQYTFNMSKTGNGIDTDTVDYSNITDNISVVVELDATRPNQYVLVDSDGASFYDAVGDLEEANDRVDVLVSVERIVAAGTGESVLDLTSSTKGLEIKFNTPALADRVANTATTNAYDVSSVRISDLASSSPLSRTFLEYRDAADVVSQASPAVDKVTAAWERIEGSDFAERVIMSSAHSFDAGTFNLRGGANEVKYNELTKSIILNLSVADFVASSPLTTGLVSGVVTFQDGTGAGVVGPLLAGSGTHTISSYTANNGIAAGSLRIAASQDAEDNLVLSGLGSKVFLIAQTGTTDNQITVQVGSGTAQNSVILTGFELITDADTDDVYDFGSIVNAVAGLDFIDNVSDHDTVKVDIGAAAADFGGVAGTTIVLSGINGSLALAPAGIDFDVLDVSGIDTATLTTLTGVTAAAAPEGTAAGVLAALTGFGASDEVVLGKINNVTSALDFESVVLTQATVAEVGTTFTMNTTTNTLVAGAKSISLTNLSNTLSFGGTVLEQQTSGALRAATALNATSGVTVTTIGTEAVNFTGGNGNDSLTGSSGNDTLRGGSGNDTLNGSFIAAVGESQTITLGGGAAVLATTDTLTLTGPGATTLVIAASGGIGEIETATTTADADQIGALLLAQTTTFLETELGYAAGSIASTAYNAASNVFTINFTPASGAQTDVTTTVSAGTMTAVAVQSVANTAQTESADTFVFEATAALNGADILSNVDATDTFEFSAFLGAGNGGGTVVAAGNAGAGFAGVVVVAADDFVVAFNKGTLATTDFVSGATLTAGKFSMADGDKAVYAVSADVNGAADSTINAWNLYYVSNGAVAGSGDLTVTLVGTVNSNAELSDAVVAAML